ncbi:MAG: hypothetical protein AAGI07_15575 [Bacteroidota bacterium]
MKLTAQKKALVVLCAGLFFIFFSSLIYYFFFHSKESIWRFLPNNLIGVLQIPVQQSEQQVEYGFWQETDWLPVQTIQSIQNANGLLYKLDSLVPIKKSITLHATGESEIDFLFIATFPKDFLQEIFHKQAQQSENAVLAEWRIRRYKEVSIYTKNMDGQLFSFYRFQNFLVGSFSSLLLEASIRTLLENDRSLPVRKLEKQIDEGEKMQQEMLLTLNTQKFKTWINGWFKSPKILLPLVDTKEPEFLQFNLTTEMGNWAATGKAFYLQNSTPKTKNNNVDSLALVTYDWQENLLYYKKQQLPNHKKILSFFTKNTSYGAKIDLLSERFDFDQHGFLANFSEYTQQYIYERPGFYQPYKLIRLAIKDSVAVVEHLAKLHPKEAINTTGFTKISQPELPQLILPESLSGFYATFYKVTKSELWLANQPVPTSFLGQVPSFSLAIEPTIYLKPNRLWGFLQKEIKAAAKNTLESFFSKVGTCSFGLERENNRVFLQLNPIKNTLKSSVPDTLFAGSIPERVKKKTQIVFNHNTFGQEFIYQDAKTRLVLLNDSGNVQWRKAIWRHGVTAVSQVDIYKNNKLQYAFASNGQIHVYDRLGRNVNGFPINLPTYFKTEFLLPLRWKNDKEQRFLVAGVVPGNTVKQEALLYLVNRYGGISRGWRPRRLEAAPATYPHYIEAEGKAHILVLLKNGSLYALNRNAKVHTGFPLITNLVCSEPMAITTNVNEKLIHILSDGGEHLMVDLKGNLIKRSKLRNPSASSHFSLVNNEIEQQGFIMVRQDEKRVNIFDEAENLLFQYSFPKNDLKEVQYYHFSQGKSIISVFSAKYQKNWLFDTSGKLLLTTPFATDVPVSIMHLPNKRKYRILSIYKKEISVFQLGA